MEIKAVDSSTTNPCSSPQPQSSSYIKEKKCGKEKNKSFNRDRRPLIASLNFRHLVASGEEKITCSQNVLDDNGKLSSTPEWTLTIEPGFPFPSFSQRYSSFALIHTCWYRDECVHLLSLAFVLGRGDVEQYERRLKFDEGASSIEHVLSTSVPSWASLSALIYLPKRARDNLPLVADCLLIARLMPA